MISGSQIGGGGDQNFRFLTPPPPPPQKRHLATGGLRPKKCVWGGGGAGGAWRSSLRRSNNPLQGDFFGSENDWVSEGKEDRGKRWDERFFGNHLANITKVKTGRKEPGSNMHHGSLCLLGPARRYETTPTVVTVSSTGIVEYLVGWGGGLGGEG